jgi:hypothetical protein
LAKHLICRCNEVLQSTSQILAIHRYAIFLVS